MKEPTINLTSIPGDPSRGHGAFAPTQLSPGVRARAVPAMGKSPTQLGAEDIGAAYKELPAHMREGIEGHPLVTGRFGDQQLANKMTPQALLEVLYQSSRKSKQELGQTYLDFMNRTAPMHSGGQVLPAQSLGPPHLTSVPGGRPATAATRV